MKLAEAFVEARIDASKIKGDMRKVEGDVKSSGDQMAKALSDAGKRATGAFVQIFSAAKFGEGIKSAIDKASDLNETVSKTEVIFGNAAGAIIDFAPQAAKSMGLSKTAYLDAASGLKGLLDNMGLAADESTKWSQDLVALGSDLGSFFNKDPAVAIEAIGSALRGETEPIRAFNVQISDAAVKQQAMTMGLYDGKGALDANAKAQATLALIMAQTSAAQGDFARTADGVANSQRTAKAEMDNSAASLGSNFLPVYQRVVQLVGLAAEGFGALPAPVQLGVVALAGMVALSGPIRSLVGIAKDVAAALGKISPEARSAGLAVGALAGVVMVGLSLRAQQVQKSNERMLESFAELSRVADADLFGTFVLSMGKAVIAGHGTDETLKKLAQTNLEGAKRVIAYSEALDAQGKLTDGQRAMMDRLREAVAAEDAALAQAAKTQETYSDATQGSTTAIEGLTAAQGANIAATAGIAGAAEQAVEAQKALLDSLDAQADSATEAADAQRDLASAINEQIEAAFNAADAQLALNKAEEDFAAAAAVTIQTQKDKGVGSAEYKAAVDDERDAMINAAKAQERLSAEQATALGVTQTATSKVDGLNSSLQHQASSATPAARRAAYEYLVQLNQIPEEKASEILALVDQGLLAEANAEMSNASRTRQAAIIADAHTSEAERKLNDAARARVVVFTIRTVGIGGALGVGNSDEGRFVAGGSNFVTSTGERSGSAGDEVILPLGNGSRMRELLSDARVGPRVAAAMAGGAMSGVGAVMSMPAASFPSTLTLIVEGEPITARIVAHDRQLASTLAAGRRA